jgi:rfaE bifunctional protein nucleotidyltransferase chain/domain
LPLVGRVLDLPGLVEELAPVRIGHVRVVLTNGVFDLLHVGHLRYLRAARALGDVLVVGVNADSSVRAAKPGRPFVSEGERAELVAALEPVDFVVIFPEPTADQLLRALRPSVYVKGADYTEAILPEAATARALGAQLAFVPLVADHSSSRLGELSRPTADRPLTVLVAGPYRSGTNDDPALIAANLRAMNEAALRLVRAGHLGLTGEAIALPLVEVAGSQRMGDAIWDDLFHPIGRLLAAHCDAVLRIGGPSRGADEMVDIARQHGHQVYFALDDVPGVA